MVWHDVALGRQTPLHICDGNMNDKMNRRIIITNIVNFICEDDTHRTRVKYCSKDVRRLWTGSYHTPALPQIRDNIIFLKIWLTIGYGTCLIVFKLLWKLEVALQDIEPFFKIFHFAIKFILIFCYYFICVKINLRT